MDHEFENHPGKKGEAFAELTRLDPPSRRGLKIQHMMYGIGVCAIVLWLVVILAFWFTSLASPLSVVLIISLMLTLVVAILIGLVVIQLSRSRTRRQTLLWALAIAAERSMPLAPAALVLADQYGPAALGWGFRGRVERLASFLNEGLPLPDAMDRVPGVFSRVAEVLARTGYATGTLARSLREAAALRASEERAWGTTASRLAYLGWLILVMQVITSFMLYFIIPKFEAIFMDFGISLPPVTIFTIEMSHIVLKYFLFFGPLIFLIEVVLPAALLIGLLMSFAVWWDLPLVNSLFRRRHSALILRLLSLAVAGRRPIPAVIERLSVEYPAGWVRERLSLVSDDIREGRNWIDSLTERSLIRRPAAAVLHSAQRVGNLEWALHETAESTDRRLGYRLQFWLQMLFPLLIVGMGALVGLFAVAYFLPLVQLIEALSR